MINNKTIQIFLFSFFFTFLCGNCHGGEKDLKNPIYIYPPKVTLFIMPLINIGDENKSLDRFENDIFTGSAMSFSKP